MWKTLILQQQSKKTQNVPICRSVLWPAAQVTGEHALLRPIMELLTRKPSFLRTRERLLRVEEVTVGLHPGGAAAVCQRAAIMTTRDDACDTSGEEGSCREGCRSLITAR